MVFALALLLVVPGAIAARWFELDDAWLKIALVPGISITLVVLSGIVVVAVTRAPFGVAHGWASLASRPPSRPGCDWAPRRSCAC